MRHHTSADLAWRSKSRGRIFDRQQRRRANLTRVATLIELEHLRRVHRGGRLLEIGAGTGRTAIPQAAARGDLVVALDASVHMIEALQAKASLPNLAPVVGVSGAELPFADNSFDTVYAFGVLTVNPDWRSVLRPVGRVLKPGGMIVFNQHNHDVLSRQGVDLRGRRGIFEPETLADDLYRLGFTLVGVHPTAFHHNRWDLVFRGRAGGGPAGPAGPPGPSSDLINLAFQDWLEANLATEGAVEAWARVEYGLGRVLPLSASPSAVIVARRLAAPSTGPSPTLEETPRADLVTGLWEVSRQAAANGDLSHPSVIRLLCLYEAWWDRLTGGDFPWTELVPDCSRWRSQVAEEIGRLSRPGISAWTGYWAWQAGQAGRHVRDAAIIRWRRLARRVN